jgi:hypothetical protein
VNTRQLKKARLKHRSYINNNPENTLVEHNGTLRPANMLDMKALPWRATRNNMEHTYAGAKKGWLDRVNRNMTKSWGRAPPRAPRLKPPPPPPPPAATAASEFGALPNVDDIPSAEVSGAVAEAKSSDNVAKDLSAAKVAEAPVTPPVAEPILEASTTPAVESSVDSNVATSESELIADMNAAEASLAVSPPSMEGDSDSSAPVDEAIVAADVLTEAAEVVAAPVEEPVVSVETVDSVAAPVEDPVVSAETVDAVAAPVDEPIVAVDVSTERLDAVAAPVEEPVVASDVSTDSLHIVTAPVDEPTVALDVPAETVDIVAAPVDEPVATVDVSTDTVDIVAAPVEEPTVATDAVEATASENESKTVNLTTVEEMSTAADSKAQNDPSSPVSSDTGDNTLIEEMNAAEALLIAASLDHQIESSGEGQSNLSSSPATDESLVEEKSAETASTFTFSDDESVLEVATGEPIVGGDAAGWTAEASSGKDPTNVDVKSVESDAIHAADVAIESSNSEVNGSVSDASSVAAMSGDTGHPVASSIEPHATKDDVILEDAESSSTVSIGHSEEDKSQMKDGDPQKGDGPHDKH